MANLKSSQKDIRRTARRTEHNRAIKSRLKTLRKRADSAIEGADKENATAAVRDYVSALDKAAKVGLVHANSVNRHKARVTHRLAQKSAS